MKKTYEAPKVSVVRFEAHDVITSSVATSATPAATSDAPLPSVAPAATSAGPDTTVAP